MGNNNVGIEDAGKNSIDLGKINMTAAIRTEEKQTDSKKLAVPHEQIGCSADENGSVDGGIRTKRQAEDTCPFPIQLQTGETSQPMFPKSTLLLIRESDDGTPEDEAAFRTELKDFYCQKGMEFKLPKFYGKPLNCLKLWRVVFKLGGYDRVTELKLWRMVGESFHPPKTCTSASWTFRIFYEKSLLEYERHKRQIGDHHLPTTSLSEASGVNSEENGYQGPGRRKAAARAMQSWHLQGLSDDVKDKNIKNVPKRQKNVKTMGSVKQNRANREMEHPIKISPTETSSQVMTSVVDIGPPADWVKINVRQTENYFEIYVLIPGLLREEVRVQLDPIGQVVITGQPEQVDNPWGLTPFKKVVRLPARINPLDSSAELSYHGRLVICVPFLRSSNS